MTNADACLYGYGRRVRVTGGRAGVIVGCLTTPRNRRGRAGKVVSGGGQRSKWIYLRMDEGACEYFKAKDLRFVEDLGSREIAEKPSDFYHFTWKD